MAPPRILHASTVAVGGAGLLIRGASGSGKSSLAISMMALGASLVADDRTCLAVKDGRIWLSAPPPIRGRIEARGLGILSPGAVEGAWLAAVLDLDREERDRLPPQRETEILGIRVPLLHKTASPVFPAALMLYLTHGRRA